MSDFKLKIMIGDAQIELEGDSEIVHTIFQELKDTGLGKLASLVQASSKGTDTATARMPFAGPFSKETEENPDNSNKSLPELPSLQDVVLQGLPQKESDWLLIYAAYASDWGRTCFTRDDLRAKYDETKRTTATRRKNFAANLKSLSTSRYISAVNDKEFRLSQTGIEKAKGILLGTTAKQKPSKSTGSAPKRILPTYKILDISLSPEERVQFKDFWNQYDHSLNMNKAILVAYWLKTQKGVVDFTANHLFTMLRTIEESASFDLSAAIKNAKKNKNCFTLGSTKGSYTLSYIGEDHVKLLKVSQEENK